MPEATALEQAKKFLTYNDVDSAIRAIAFALIANAEQSQRISNTLVHVEQHFEDILCTLRNNGKNF